MCHLADSMTKLCHRGEHSNALQFLEKVQVGDDQEKSQSERDSHSKHRGGKN